MPKINFSVSNLFVIMNMNYFKKFDKVVFTAWRQFNRDDYKKYSDLSTKKAPLIVPKNLSSKKQLDAYQVKYGFNISKQVFDCQSSNTSAEVVKKKAEIMESLPKKIKKADLAEIKKLVDDSSNTIYGVKNESKAVATFQKEQKCVVANSQACSRIEILIDTSPDDCITLIGKVDGLNEKGEVVEIKNRVNKLFNELRSYEKPQIMSYMWMNKTNKGYMVENLRKKEGNSMNTIEVAYEKDYVEKEVIPNLKRFYRFFMDFMENEEWKLDLLRGEEAKIYDIFMKQY